MRTDEGGSQKGQMNAKRQDCNFRGMTLQKIVCVLEERKSLVHELAALYFRGLL